MSLSDDTLQGSEVDETLLPKTTGILVVGDDQFFLDQESQLYHIGRDVNCDIVLPYQCVSRKHAAIEITNGFHFMTVHSNFTYRGAVRLLPNHEYELHDGDNLKFGSDCKATYQIQSARDNFIKPSKVENISSLPLASPPERFCVRENQCNESSIPLCLEASVTDQANISRQADCNINQASVDPKFGSANTSVDLVIADEDDYIRPVDNDLDDTRDTVDEPEDFGKALGESEIIEMKNTDRSETPSTEPTSCVETMEGIPCNDLFSVPPIGATHSSPSSLHWKTAVVENGKVSANIEEDLAQIHGDESIIKKSKRGRKSKVAETNIAVIQKAKPGRKSSAVPMEKKEEIKTAKLEPKRKSVIKPPSPTFTEPDEAPLDNPTPKPRTNSRKSVRRSPVKPKADDDQQTDEEADLKPKKSKKAAQKTDDDTEVERTPSSKSNPTITTGRRKKPLADAKLLATGNKDESVFDLIKKVGATYVEDDLTICTHLIVAGPCKRTVKFVCCVGRGIPIANITWLTELLNGDPKAHPEDFPPEGLDTLEACQHFSLKQTLESARRKKLLEGYSVYAIPNTTKLSEKDLKCMVKAAGGKLMTRSPKSFAENTIVICGDAAVGSDQAQPAVVAKPPNVGEFVALKIPLVSTEFLLAGILRYDADPAHFPIEIQVNYDMDQSAPINPTAKTPAKSRRTTVVTKHVDENNCVGEEKPFAEKSARKTSKKQISNEN